MASKVCSLFFKPNSSDSIQNNSSTDKIAKKINYWAVASAVFLIAGVAATTIGSLGYFNIVPILESFSEIILSSGIISLSFGIAIKVLRDKFWLS